MKSGKFGGGSDAAPMLDVLLENGGGPSSP
jgi:hypothetical protein